MGVYCLMTEDKSSVKVGYTSNIEKIEQRIKQLQTACPFKLLLIGYNENLGKEDEKEIHAALKGYKTEGGGTEWFSTKSLHVIEYFLDINPNNGISVNEIKFKITGKSICFKESICVDRESNSKQILNRLGIDTSALESEVECKSIHARDNFCQILKQPLVQIFDKCGIKTESDLHLLGFSRKKSVVDAFFIESQPVYGMNLVENLLLGHGSQCLFNSRIACQAIVFHFLKTLYSVDSKVFTGDNVTWVFIKSKLEDVIFFVEEIFDQFNDIFLCYKNRLRLIVTNDYCIVHNINCICGIETKTEFHQRIPIAYYH